MSGLTLILPSLLLLARAGEPDWDVEAAHGPTHVWKATLTQGTWISVDVNPDGDLVAFDLLGDLYVVPLEGGRARRLTTGPAWDQDPRWSPDGRRLLYVSDRSGNQDVWIRDMDTGEASQVTHGRPERFVEATWSPDGRDIVARKRITDQRSIGMCELWLIDPEGGDGVRLTSTDDHPFPVEPAFSPDGRYLYFSSTPWRFEYDRNPYTGIFDLYRMDMDDGEVVRLTAEAGSTFGIAVNPVDGTLAVMRRRPDGPDLEILDPDRGTRRVVATGLEHDNQEGFAINRIYPHSSWTPDGAAVLLWDDGGIVRVDAATGRRSPVPFEAHTRQVLTEPVHAKVPLARGEAVRARAIRWPVVSPDGSTVVFEAFGRLWSQPVGGGRATSFTDPDLVALAPSWSPDGSMLAYATWDDDRGGSVRTRDMRSGEEHTVVRAPAQFLAPTFSPDGRRIAWLRSSAAVARGHETGDELWWRLEHRAVGGGEVVEAMLLDEPPGIARTRIGWSAGGTRLLLAGDEKGEKAWVAPKTVLRSYDLRGHDEREVARWKEALEVAVSPAGDQVAWVEDYRVFTAPLPPAAGRLVELGPEEGAFQATRRDERAGTWLSWSGGTPTWTSGPELRLGDRELRLSASLPRVHGEGLTAWVHARVLTMDPELGVLDDATVVVDGERISSVGADPPPAGALVVDASGRTLMPGLIDVHAHLHYGFSDVLPERSWRHAAELAYGVTTVHDPSAPDYAVFPVAERIAAGLEPGPRVLSTGGVLYGAKSRGHTEIRDLDDARFHVARQAAVGAVSIKDYQQPARFQRQMLVQAAREAGVNAYPEGGGDLFQDLSMLADGHTGNEHALPVAPLYADVIGFYAATGAGYTPTLLVAYGGVFGELWFYQSEDLLHDSKFLRFTPPEWVDRKARRLPLEVRDGDWFFQELSRAAAKLHEAGVPIQLGAHGQVQGLGTHWELWALGEALGPKGALEAATVAAAHYLGIEDDAGRLAPGLLADMLVIDGDPLEKLRDSVRIVEVVQGGRRFDGETLEPIR